MNTLEKTVEQKLQLWALLGPFCVLFTLIFASLRPDASHLYLPYATLIGIPLCWKWKLRGLAMSLGILSALVVYHWTEILPEERLWELGITFALSLGFLVTALSFEEISSSVKSFQTHTEGLVQEVDQLRKQAQTHVDFVESYEKLVAMAREELINLSRENESLKQEFIAKRQELELKHERALEKVQGDQSHLIKKHYDKQLHDLQKEHSQITTRCQELERHRDQLLERLHATEQSLKEEKSEDQDPRRYMGLYTQLREQFDEKSKTLDETRRELFLAQEKQEQLRIEKEEIALYTQSEHEKKLERYILSMEQEFSKKERALEKEISDLHEIIANLSRN